MSKWTEGEWSTPHLCSNNIKCNCRYILAEGYMGSIAEISVDNGKTVSDGGNDCPPIDVAIANAHLISAAPDLYESLVLAIGAIKEICHERSIPLPETTINRGEKALRKARGE